MERENFERAKKLTSELEIIEESLWRLDDKGRVTLTIGSYRISGADVDVRLGEDYEKVVEFCKDLLEQQKRKAEKEFKNL